MIIKQVELQAVSVARGLSGLVRLLVEQVDVEHEPEIVHKYLSARTSRMSKALLV